MCVSMCGGEWLGLGLLPRSYTSAELTAIIHSLSLFPCKLSQLTPPVFSTDGISLSCIQTALYEADRKPKTCTVLFHSQLSRPRARALYTEHKAQINVQKSLSEAPAPQPQDVFAESPYRYVGSGAQVVDSRLVQPD
jgi:hypothetical protein